MPDKLPHTLQALRCPGCLGALLPDCEVLAPHAEGSLRCPQCLETFPIVHGIPRMLLAPLREALLGQHTTTRGEDQQVATARSFGFEWQRFPEMHAEWERNFLDYMAPYPPAFLRGKRVLDAGCGSGRHAYYAARYGAEVWAIDLGAAVEVARRNTMDCATVHVVQADLRQLPFAPESFDFIYSFGVLHHLPEPEAAFRHLLRFLKPGGEIRIYLYWQPEGQALKQALLTVVTAIRSLTTRLPYKVVYALSFPMACMVFTCFVWPAHMLRRIPCLQRWAERMPMQQYARYPFRVCVNDQFDRFSAPIENRYTRAEVEAWLQRAGLENIDVQPNCGWGGFGRKPLAGPTDLSSADG